MEELLEAEDVLDTDELLEATELLDAEELLVTDELLVADELLTAEELLEATALLDDELSPVPDPPHAASIDRLAAAIKRTTRLELNWLPTIANELPFAVKTVNARLLSIIS